MTSLSTVAHHEAGHVLAECRWGDGAPLYATLRPRPRADGRISLGYVQPSGGILPANAPLDLQREQDLGIARFLLAGMAAEEVLNGQCPWGASDEIVAEEFDGDRAEAERACFGGAYLSVPEFREACECIEAAHGRRARSAREERKRVAREYRVVLAFLRAHWQHVTAVASALMRRKHLSGEAIERILAKLPPLDNGTESEGKGS